jgi:glycosyltransferase involved in cell wall biosynthesis
MSYVIPAHDESGFVDAALESVRQQLWPPGRVEAVVVENASADATGPVVERYAEKHDDLSVRLVHLDRPGVARARNAGALAAQGRILMFLDADSRADPALTAHVVQRVDQGFAAGCVRIVADTRDPLDRGFFALVEFGKRCFGIRAQMFYCLRDVFLAAGGFDERLHQAEDRDILCRLMQAGIDVCLMPETWIATSARRLHRHPLRLGMATTLVRWAMGQAGLARTWRY